MSTLALTIILYKILGGSNVWLRTHGFILVTFYAIGSLAYDELEGWGMLDTCYFLTVTITTVGYGDICPESASGKLFTVVYALFGMVFVFAALSPLVDALMWFKGMLLTPCRPPEEDSEGWDLQTLRAKGNWGFKYFDAAAGPLVIFVLGLIIGFTVMSLDLVDGICTRAICPHRRTPHSLTRLCLSSHTFFDFLSSPRYYRLVDDHDDDHRLR